MEFFSIITGVVIPLFSAIFGGAMTYMVFYLKQKPSKLTWHLSQGIRAPDSKITAIQLVVRNDGAKPGQNVRMHLSYPESAVIETFHVNISEPATPYQITSGDDGGNKSVFFPIFPVGVDCLCTIFAKNLERKDIRVSVVSEDGVGTSSSLYDLSVIRKGAILHWILSAALFFFISLASMIVVALMFISSSSYEDVRSSVSLAKIYLDLDQPLKAVEILEDVETYALFFERSTAYVDYHLAISYAMSNQDASALNTIEKVLRAHPGYLGPILRNEEFQRITETPEFKDLARKYEVAP